MKFSITYIRTLIREETIEAATREEAEQHAKERAWNGELLNSDFETSETEFEVEEAGQVPEKRIRLVESTSLRAPKEKGDPKP